jgi:hypothetical protein
MLDHQLTPQDLAAAILLFQALHQQVAVEVVVVFLLSQGLQGDLVAAAAQQAGLAALATPLRHLLRKAITVQQGLLTSEAEVVAEQALLGQGATEAQALIAPLLDPLSVTRVAVHPTQQQDAETQQKAVAESWEACLLWRRQIEEVVDMAMEQAHLEMAPAAPAS